MNEPERAENFTRDVDALLRGETPPMADADDRALLDLARDLLAADFSAETRLDLLRPRLAKPTLKGLIMSPRYRYVRWFVTTAALFTLIVAIILTVPPLRAIAQDILRQIGIYNVTDAPTSYEISQRPIPAIELVRLVDEGDWYPTTAEQIETDGAWLAMVEGIPTGFDTVDYGFATRPDDHLGFPFAKYTQSGNSEKEVSLGQLNRLHRSGPIDYQTGGAITEETTVNGNKAVWVSGFTEHPDLDVQMLIWEVDIPNLLNYGQLIVLKGRRMTKDEMLEIARSVTFRDRLSVLPNPDNAGWTTYTPGQVADEVGFQVAVIEHPTALHKPVYTRHFGGGDDFTQVNTTFDYGGSMLSLQQVKVHDASLVQDGVWEYAVGDTPVEDVRVNGNPGVWVEGMKWYSNSQRDILLWEQDGFSFSLSGNGVLTRDDMIDAAESIEYVWPGQPEERASSPRKLLPAAIVAGQTGFAVAEPEYIPQGYRLIARDSKRGSDVISAITVYDHENDDALVLHQGEYPDSVTPRDLALSDSRLIDVTVSGSPAIWVAEYVTYPDTQVGMLVWEQDGTILRLQSAALDRDEMIRIAESLKYVGSPDF